MKFKVVQTNQREERQEDTMEHELGGNDGGLGELLFLELVIGDRSVSGKRKRRAGQTFVKRRICAGGLVIIKIIVLIILRLY